MERTQPDERSRGQYVEMMERAAALADDLVDNVAGQTEAQKQVLRKAFIKGKIEAEVA